MDVQRAIQIAKREWENIRLSLQMCGDIGEFHSINHINSSSAIVSETLPLIN